MGKPPYVYTDSETDDTNSLSSIENKKKKKFSFASSILKYTNGNVKKKKCKIHSKSEPEDSDYRSRSSRSRSNQRVRYKLPGILKKTYNESNRETSEDEDDIEPFPPRSQHRYLVGRVPRPPGAKPGRGGGVAIIVKKNVSAVQGQPSSTAEPKRSSAKKESWHRRLVRKRSY
ncbi:hypothetical protein PYW07_009709 [Mythimna separata]|uniref:Uncharacterized protein n=1 Tax=Mythimna separata TaxID=271217 RepID=A0AAD8DMI0_MYTSE|nr:hypothetical protein PYW07_009709 [Mythimna separata]